MGGAAKRGSLILLISLLVVYVITQLIVVIHCKTPFKVWINMCNTEKAFLFYAANLRGNLFAGFLALGGFLLSLKTFIIVTMKENVYDNQNYIEKVKNNNGEIEPTKKELYKPLKELSDILVYSIWACIISAVSQITLGLIFNKWLLLANIALPTCAVILLCYSLILIKRNLDHVFE